MIINNNILKHKIMKDIIIEAEKTHELSFEEFEELFCNLFYDLDIF